MSEEEILRALVEESIAHDQALVTALKAELSRQRNEVERLTSEARKLKEELADLQQEWQVKMDTVVLLHKEKDEDRAREKALREELRCVKEELEKAKQSAQNVARHRTELYTHSETLKADLAKANAEISGLREDAEHWRDLMRAATGAAKEGREYRQKTPLEERIRHLAAEVAVMFLNTTMTSENTTALADEIRRWATELVQLELADSKATLSQERSEHREERERLVDDFRELYHAYENMRARNTCECELEKTDCPSCVREHEAGAKAERILKALNKSPRATGEEGGKAS